MKHQHEPRYGRKRRNRGQPRITSGQLTVLPHLPHHHPDQYHYQSSDDDYPYASSSHVKSEPGDVKLSNGQGASSYYGNQNGNSSNSSNHSNNSNHGNNSNYGSNCYNSNNSNNSYNGNNGNNSYNGNNVNNGNNVSNGNNITNGINGDNRPNAFEDDSSMSQAMIVEAIRSRIAEIDKDFPRLARTKAKIYLELDRHDPRGAVHSRLLATHQDSLQTFADLKERRDTLTEVLADLMLVQGPQGTAAAAAPAATAVAAAQPAVATGSAVRVLPERNACGRIVDRGLVMKPNMPRFGYSDRPTTFSEPEEFLHRFQQYMTSFLGLNRLKSEGYRYMVALIEDVQLQTELYEEFEFMDKALLTFQECAHVFRDLTGPVNV
ncbi:hypothetical protein BGZ70_001581 [Mortierella alpina]|uniref:Uncharacterized protein n=1 Tax=Mortierella alpina TaxID=64518 RepID=A0A9P6JC97_MORAP|nr:hypothetical protein BGZ70_001581 [Mortierella alpina]